MPADAIRLRRSALYLPASNARAIAKARTLPADVIILDLEDAVAPEAKDSARQQMRQALDEGGFGGRELVVRVNGLDTPWGADDLAVIRTGTPDAVLIPKVNEAADLAGYAERLGGALPLWAMVETARSLFRLEAIAAAPGLEALVVGTNDLAKELRASPGRDRLPFQGFLASTVAAARAYGRAVFDGVFNDVADAEGFAAEAAQGARFGFDGKTLIHPDQIAPCHRAFAPDADELAWARSVERAFAAPQAAGRGVIMAEGRMVERLHLDQARRILALAAASSDTD